MGLQKTIERYNLVMDYVNIKTSSPEEKQFFCYLVANLIPDMNDLSFSEISNMLNIVNDGF